MRLFFLQTNWLRKLLASGLLFVLALLPIHAVISTWAISNFGNELIFKSWKEIVLIVLSIPALLLVWKDSSLLLKLTGRRVNLLIFAYILWSFIVTGFNNAADTEAAIAGAVINFRFFGIFLLGQIVALSYERKKLKEFKDMLLGVVLAGGALVSVFGLLQVFVLPSNFLEHFGYGPDTIPPYQTIDKNSDFVRINSTLRGPNPLGFFMVLVLSLLTCLWLKPTKSLKSKRWLVLLVGFAGMVTIYASHSRSAWLGLAVALGIITLELLGKYKTEIMLVLATGLVVLASLFTVFKDTNFVQNVFLHRDPNDPSQAINSTEAHWQANIASLERIAKDPLGDGLGSSGPASFYADSPRIPENYFLQIGEEVGLVGLIIFMAIIWQIGVELFRLRNQPVVMALFASLCGLLVASMFAHVWANEVVALTWWGLAGVWIWPEISKTQTKRAV